MDDGEWTFSREGRNVSAKFPTMCLSAGTVSDVKVVGGIRTHDCNLSHKHRKTDAAGRLPPIPPFHTSWDTVDCTSVWSRPATKAFICREWRLFWQIDLSQYKSSWVSFLSDTSSRHSRSYNLFFYVSPQIFYKGDVNIIKLITIKFLTPGILRPFLECDFLKYDS
jgi:hypothetical protein